MYSSRVEEQYIGNNGFESQSSKIPYLIVDSFPDLGLITTLRFFVSFPTFDPKKTATFKLIKIKMVENKNLVIL